MPVQRFADRVVVVTGGGGGLGSAISRELAGQGAAVVVLDAGVGVQGEPLGEETAGATAEAITASGGTARGVRASVTDLDQLQQVFHDVVRDLGSLDAVINTAGYLRYAQLPHTKAEDWDGVLEVHLDGYLNVLSAALPLMAAAGYGRIVGVTSGVGLARTSVDGPAYGSAKRAVAALTWQLGRQSPPGVTVNALSPIAATRMVTGALVAAGVSPKGLDLSSMPQPESIAPAAAYLASEQAGWCTGRVVFCCGSELTLMAPPQTVEAVRSVASVDVATALDTVVPEILSPAEANQCSTGGSNPRLGTLLVGDAS